MRPWRGDRLPGRADRLREAQEKRPGLRRRVADVAGERDRAGPDERLERMNGAFG